jgi:glycerol-3-phosphate dehydrogenase (NAD(P)+)
MSPRQRRPLRVLVAGDGGWGTALALLLTHLGHDVALWSHDAEYAEEIARTRVNPRYLPGFELPAALRVGHDGAGLAQGAELVVSAVPTQYVRATWSGLCAHLPPGVPVLSVTKGLEEGTLLRPTEVLAELVRGHPVAVLSGPNIAREVARGLPAATVVASAHEATARLVQHALSSERFRVYLNPDVVGVELGGALKNVIALAAGMCDGLELGANAKAALLSRGLLEMARLGVAFGGQRPTFFGLSGLGDLITTAYSESSRNRTFGERLGRGERPADIAGSMRMVAEGVKSAAPLHDLMRRHGISMPIAEQVYHVLHQGKPVREVVRDLMLRGPKDESEDLAVPGARAAPEHGPART